jgi:SNF2 family DNA or RNA helicase
VTKVLFDYQAVGAAWLATARQGLLMDEQGLGKTTQAIHAVRALYEAGEDPFPVFIVCPNSVKPTWKREFEEWWPGIEVQVIKGGAAQRRKQLEKPAHVYVLNWESIRLHSRLAPYGAIALKRCKECGGEDERVTHARCETHLRELNQLTFGTIIADEIHRSKSPSAKQTRALWSISDKAEFRFALTGTPIANAPDDLWSILRFLSPAEFPSRSRYVQRWCAQSFNAFGQPTVIGLRPETRDEFFRITNSRMRRMPKSLVLDFLPPVIKERRDVEMNDKQKKAYDDMRDHQIAMLDEESVLSTTSPLTKLMRLMQFASSHATIETQPDGSELVRLAEPSNKIDAFVEDLTSGDFGEDSIVVMAESRQLIDLLSKRLDKLGPGYEHGLITGGISGDERQRHIDEFQAGKTRLILCTIKAGGTGLTLTKARVIVFLQRSWSVVDQKQAEARVHRIGSEMHDSILQVDYVAPDTVEEVQIHALEGKGERLEEIVRDRDLMIRVLKGEVTK